MRFMFQWQRYIFSSNPSVPAIILARLCHRIGNLLPQAWQDFANAMAKRLKKHMGIQRFFIELSLTCSCVGIITCLIVLFPFVCSIKSWHAVSPIL